MPARDRPLDDLTPRADPEVAHPACTVHLNGAFRQPERLGDLGRGVSVGDEPEHLSLTRSQVHGGNSRKNGLVANRSFDRR
jgi:hypothetical protein